MKDRISIDISKALQTIDSESYEKRKRETMQVLHTLENKKGAGNEFTGWLDFASRYTDKEIENIIQQSEKLRNNSEAIVVIGIGGSYLGGRAIIEAAGSFFKQNDKPEILYAGHHLSERYQAELNDYLKDKEFSLVVISKSGTTTEPAIAFRILRTLMEQKYTKNEIKDRILVVTDKKKGALRKLAAERDYPAFVIPDDIGGRYSVITAVGLIPMACAGIDIRAFIKGVAAMETMCDASQHFDQNYIAQYALLRNELHRSGKQIEMMVHFSPELNFFAEWWKQLFGESEGKENKGIFPASAGFTTDLHSLGQYIQEGSPILFETLLSIESSTESIAIPSQEDNTDKLNYLAGKHIEEVNKMAELGTMMAHQDRNVPVVIIKIPEINLYYLGQLVLFFEKSCALSGYLMKVNPFDQPGVEAYKTNMFKLLEKPGYV